MLGLIRFESPSLRLSFFFLASLSAVLLACCGRLSACLWVFWCLGVCCRLFVFGFVGFSVFVSALCHRSLATSGGPPVLPWAPEAPGCCLSESVEFFYSCVGSGLVPFSSVLALRLSSLPLRSVGAASAPFHSLPLPELLAIPAILASAKNG